MILHQLGKVIVYLVEVYNSPNGEVTDLDDDMYLVFPEDHVYDYDEMLSMCGS